MTDIKERLLMRQLFLYFVWIVLILKPCSYKLDLYTFLTTAKRRAYLVCPSSKRLIMVRPRPGMLAGCASACVRLFPVLPRMSLHGSRLARVKCSCRQSQYNFWTSLGEFGREKQSVCTTDMLNVYIGTCWGRGFRGGLLVGSRCDLSPTDLRAVPFLCNITDVTSEPRGLCSM